MKEERGRTQLSVFMQYSNKDETAHSQGCDSDYQTGGDLLFNLSCVLISYSCLIVLLFSLGCKRRPTLIGLCVFWQPTSCSLLFGKIKWWRWRLPLQMHLSNVLSALQLTRMSFPL